MPFIQASHQFQLLHLLLGRKRGILQKWYHLLRIQVAVIHIHSLMFTRQKPIRPQFSETYRTTRTAYNVIRKVGIFGSQTVREPCAQCWPVGCQRSVIHHEQRWTMIGIVRIHRSYNAQIIRALGRVGQQFTDFQTAATMLGKFERHRHQRACRSLGAKVGGRGSLAGKFVQIRLGVEEVALERTTVHEQLDDTFGLRSVLRRLFWRRVQHVGQGQQAKTTTRRLNHAAA